MQISNEKKKRRRLRDRNVNLVSEASGSLIKKTSENIQSIIYGKCELA